MRAVGRVASGVRRQNRQSVRVFPTRVLQVVHEGALEAVQLTHQRTAEFPCPGVVY